ncbi:MAG: histidine kinase [Lachnospiraceae bacterium]|nr:histidine kinase [Lachnospiraceae bacterium]
MKHTWLLICNAVLMTAGGAILLRYGQSMTNEAYLGGFCAFMCMGILLILSISCVGEIAGDISSWFKLLLLLDMILSLTSIGTNAFEGNAELVLVNYFLEFLLFSSVTLLCCFYWYYIRRELMAERKLPVESMKRRSRAVNCTAGVSILLLILNQFSGFLFRINEAGVYQRSPLFLISWVCPSLVLVSTTVLILSQKIRLSWKLVHLSYSILPVVIYPIQVVHAKMMPLNIATTFSLLLMYCVNYMNRRDVMLKQKERLAVTEKEMLELEVQLMISQIQPHFLYNTIAMIRGLCREDPEGAADSLGYFASFLRGSLHMMQEKECISIEEELKLVDSYMYLEQKRFGERLEYIEDVEDVSFRLPAMTIEPLLENAIHHGVTKKEEGGMILLEVAEQEESYVIRITDNGIGFDTNRAVDTKQHVGMQNVRERLRSMCGGTLELVSVVGEGTSAVIRIPREPV